MLALAGSLTLPYAPLMPAAMAQNADKQQQKQQLENKKGKITENLEEIQRRKNAAKREAQKHRNEVWRLEKQRAEKERSIKYHERNKNQTIHNMVYLDQKLDQTQGEAFRLSEDAALRMRNLYMGERTSMLQMILEAKDISTLLDRMYYKKRIVEQDRQLLENLKGKMEEIKVLKVDLARQKTLLDQSIQTIQVQKNILEQTSETYRKMMDKYQREADTYTRMENELLRESASITAQLQQLLGKQPKEAASGSTGQFMWPVQGRLTSRFGYRTHPIHRVRKMHTGLDIAASHGTPIKAADGGQVIFAGWKGGYGKAVMINHGYRNGKNLVTLYGHMSNIGVRTGQQVGKGSSIGNVGSTGYATGPHLHFEIRENGAPVDPMRYL